MTYIVFPGVRLRVLRRESLAEAEARYAEMLPRERYGVDVNDAANGIPLGHPSPHNFTHREPFLQRVNQRLEQVVEDRTARGFGARALRTELRRELRGIGREVEGEVSTGVPSPTAVWTAPY
ncbi:AHH domain-containing protein [Streptomyces sp. NPDC087263]|uniref:AHH domain-containing protein n=1 Tax=Streptomyces sp. NPDC087263 TaxID=3365773 RepID=UPI00382B73CA